MEREELASGLIGKGQKIGERIALIGENSAAWIIACLAVWRAGGVCVPIDTQFSDELDQGRAVIFLAGILEKFCNVSMKPHMRS